MPEIDWIPFDEFPEHTIECHCGAVFRSHCKVKSVDSKLHIFTRKPCPACASNSNVRRASSDPETMTIKG